MTEIVNTEDLQLGDTVRQTGDSFGGPFTTCVITQVTDDAVTLFRPYATTADFSYVGNRVIPYIGIEEYSVEKSNKNIRWHLFNRKEIR